MDSRPPLDAPPSASSSEDEKDDTPATWSSPVAWGKGRTPEAKTDVVQVLPKEHPTHNSDSGAMAPVRSLSIFPGLVEPGRSVEFNPEHMDAIAAAYPAFCDEFKAAKGQPTSFHVFRTPGRHTLTVSTRGVQEQARAVHAQAFLNFMMSTIDDLRKEDIYIVRSHLADSTFRQQPSDSAESFPAAPPTGQVPESMTC